MWHLFLVSVDIGWTVGLDVVLMIIFDVHFAFCVIVIGASRRGKIRSGLDNTRKPTRSRWSDFDKLYYRKSILLVSHIKSRRIELEVEWLERWRRAKDGGNVEHGDGGENEVREGGISRADGCVYPFIYPQSSIPDPMMKISCLLCHSFPHSHH